MKLKTLQAPTLKQALALVHAEIGPDAVVLHTRHARRKGILGWLGGTLVEVTAADGRDVARARAKQNKARRPQPTRAARPARPPARKPQPATIPQPVAASHEQWPPNGSTAELIKHAYQAVKDDLAKSTPPPPAPLPQPQVIPLPPEPSHLSREMREVKAVLAKLVSRQTPATPDNLPTSLAERYLQLIQQEVAEELAAKAIAQAREATTNPDCDTACTHSLRKALSSLLPVAPEPAPTTTGTHIIALIGPTGVGKTTTLAKLATQLTLEKQRKVVLITIDTYRIAAVDQLRTYAEILNLQLEVIQRPEQMAETIAKHKDADTILIDTAGRSPKDAQRISELKQFIQHANPHEIHLVLASTATERSMLDTHERFSPLNPTHLIFTKIDEAICFGSLMNVLTITQKRLSYITTGQEVPHDIEHGSAERLADLMLNPEG
ncbi:flagellar biosynthesis protein FlhF [Mucisphaera sp.]|uniref:flagellar biosynthesis protein FlhF n=1 Tax=Mucisphaera sp. TaxID=2913024 RepID=UPI003D1062AE